MVTLVYLRLVGLSRRHALAYESFDRRVDRLLNGWLGDDYASRARRAGKRTSIAVWRGEMAVLRVIVGSIVLLLRALLGLHLLNVVGLLSIRWSSIRLLLGLSVLLLRVHRLRVISWIVRLLLVLLGVVIVLRLRRILLLDVLIVSLGVVGRCRWWRTRILMMRSARPAEDGLVGSAALVWGCSH